MLHVPHDEWPREDWTGDECVSGRSLSWLPAERRDEYFALSQSKSVGTPRARRIMLDRILRKDRVDLPYPIPDTIFYQRRVILTAVHMCYINEEDLMGTLRGKLTVPCRQAIIYTLRDKNPCVWSYGRMGKILHRDHSTIIHAWQQAQAKMETDPWFTKLVARLRDC